MELIRHNCWCNSCHALAHAELGPTAGQVVGNGNLRSWLTGKWGCVYCGLPVTGGEGRLPALWHSLCSWASMVGFEHTHMGKVSKYPWVRLYAHLRHR